MNSVWVRKGLYPLYLISVFSLSFWLIGKFQSPVTTFAALALLFLPGRIQGYFFRDFFTGRKLMGAKDYEKARLSFQSFNEQLKKRPWQRHLIWLTFAVNTTDIRAMTFNNLAACCLELGQLSIAEEYLCAALSTDPKYPMPYYNRAVLLLHQNDQDGAKTALLKAKELGFTGNAYDRLLISLGQGLAELEGSSDLPMSEELLEGSEH